MLFPKCDPACDSVALIGGFHREPYFARSDPRELAPSSCFTSMFRARSYSLSVKPEIHLVRYGIRLWILDCRRNGWLSWR